jgi:hypothetical protein
LQNLLELVYLIFIIMNTNYDYTLFLKTLIENMKKITIPNVPKEERESFPIGCHDIPNWMLYTLGVMIILNFIFGMLCVLN